MPSVAVYSAAGKKNGTMELSDSIFGIEPNMSVVHLVVVNYLANQRQGTQSTLTRSEVAGGGRKPWRQKGTGHARQGSIRAPQWKGGGVVFAPTPRDYSFKLNKKEKRAAIRSALTSKVQDEKFIVLEDLTIDEIKTKKVKAVLDNLNVNKAIILMDKNDKNVVLSANNLPNVATAYINVAAEDDAKTISSNINVYDILKNGTVVTTKAAVAFLEEVYA